MPYTYDYTRAETGDESALRRYWRFAKMTLTRLTRANTFAFNGRTYSYLYHFCNKTWKNERGVEIPIFRDILLRHQTARILEVGNVLSHYVPIHHDVVDKYEVAPGVINQDIVEFAPTARYDLILNISTLEHVGWDEVPREPAKLLQAIEHLRGIFHTHIVPASGLADPLNVLDHLLSVGTILEVHPQHVLRLLHDHLEVPDVSLPL